MSPRKAHRFAIVRACFNGEITRALLDGATRAFADARIGGRKIEVFEVPGSFELPLAARWLAGSGKFSAIVCLGCVIRGETPHFEYVAGEAARGIAAVALETGVPVIFGVLTTDTAEQAWARAGRQSRGTADHVAGASGGNKGYEAAQAAIEMAWLRDRMRPKRR